MYMIVSYTPFTYGMVTCTLTHVYYRDNEHHKDVHSINDKFTRLRTKESVTEYQSSALVDQVNHMIKWDNVKFPMKEATLYLLRQYVLVDMLLYVC